MRFDGGMTREKEGVLRFAVCAGGSASDSDSVSESSTTGATTPALGSASWDCENIVNVLETVGASMSLSSEIRNLNTTLPYRNIARVGSFLAPHHDGTLCVSQ